MKIFLCLSLLVSTSAWTKTTVANFNKALNEDVQKEIRKDDDKFKKALVRGPASVEIEHEQLPVETPKIDKNIRQIGPNKW